MSEYWVSKKQYWCKYCNIWIRDDAPSRSLHESGLKHQGNRERYIRDIYRGGERAKREKDTNAKEFARIEAAAKAAHSKDTNTYAGRPAPNAPASSSASTASSVPRPPKAAGDKWANYSSAAQLGFNDADTQLSSFEIEQMVRGRGTKVGGWEEVREGPGVGVVYGEDGVPALPVEEKHEGVGEGGDGDEDDHESFKIRVKRHRDPYDDDWDPAALGGIKLKNKERKIGEDEVEEETGEREDKGKGEGKGWSRIGQEKAEAEEEVKAETNAETEAKAEPGADAAPAPSEPAPAPSETKPEIQPEPAAAPAPAPAGSMFKKRRPPPSSRKK